MSHRLWYESAATCWSQGLPIGNGQLGAVVMSSPKRTVLSIDEITFWSGQPEDPKGPRCTKEILATIRENYFADDFDSGQTLSEQYLQPPKSNYGTNLGLGNLVIDLEHLEEHETSFMRELNLDEAIAHAETKFGAEQIKTEVFVSHLHQVLVMKLTSSSSTKIPIRARFSFQANSKRCELRAVGKDELAFKTEALEDVHSDGTCGVKAVGSLRIISDGELAICKDSSVQICGASSALLLMAVKTDYMSDGIRYEEVPAQRIQTASELGYDKLRLGHIHDHQSLYLKCTLHLESPTNVVDLPTDQRQELIRSSTADPAFFALYFHYGRYLAVTGSRQGSLLPLHLQGLWNDREANKMNWSCDYHLDINTQMNYFPTEMCNLPECHGPLAEYISRLAGAGRETASYRYNCHGWVAHVFSNVWGFADPGWETSWGLNVTGGLWIAAHMIEHFEYTQDYAYLRNVALPVLEGAAEFFLDYMTQHPTKGFLVTGPSVSPENTFFAKGSGKEYALSLAPSIDIILVRDLFNFCKNHCQNSSMRLNCEQALSLLPPFQIGQRGQLQEWLDDYEEAQPDHRHISHLIAMIRSSQISLRETPHLAQALRVTLDSRRARSELEDIEFTAVLFAMAYARLNDAKSALWQLTHLVTELSLENLLSFSKSGIAGAETNIFVIDGNLGATAAVAEMLLRSAKEGEIELLPALPIEWSNGSLHSLRARGGIEVDMVWENGKLNDLVVKSSVDHEVKIFYQGCETTVQMLAAEVCRWNSNMKLVSQSYYGDKSKAPTTADHCDKTP